MEVHYNIELHCNTSDGADSVTTSEGRVIHPELGSADAGRNGPSPETLLMAAISTSYSITLSSVLREACLPRSRVSVRADGVTVGSHGRPKFTRVRVSPTIRGADVLRRGAYEKAATVARDDCPIGCSIRGNVAYIVGDVVLLR